MDYLSYRRTYHGITIIYYLVSEEIFDAEVWDFLPGWYYFMIHYISGERGGVDGVGV